MDRTIIIPYRAEEKELSQIFYKAIQGLILLHPPTDDLRKCLSDEMFIKPNQQAFFHIMHYLFRLLDPQEFKKRFFWPITDKRAESNFRTSTVEYLKHINEKYQLNWTNIKSYLVVMPGGMKFINFLLDFVNFIVQELIKQKEKQLNLDANNYRAQVSEVHLHKICAKNECFKGMASEFIDAVENLNTKYEEKSKKLVNHLEELSRETDLSVDSLTDQKFLDSFEKHNNHLFNKYYRNRSEKLFEMDTLISEVKEAMDKFYSKETGYKYDKERICMQLKRIRDNFPTEELVEESFGSKVTDEGVNINTLISTFNAINKTIQNELRVFNNKPCTGEFVYTRLLSLKKELQEMETQITTFKKNLHENMKRSGKTDLPKTPITTNISGQTKSNLENSLLMKLVSTPPIKFELPEGGGKSRLALVDSKAANTNESFNNFLAPPRACSIRQPNHHHSFGNQTMSDLNNTMNRSKIIDPMQLLRSTSKKDTAKYKTNLAKADISSLGTKWKLRQTILNENNYEDDLSPKTHFKTLITNETSPQTFIKTASNTILHQSPFTPFGCNERTKIARTQYQLDSSVIGDANSCGSPLNFLKKLSAVKKVQDASLNFTDLSTSPSGRLEPLVTAVNLDMPKLKVNDISLLDHNLSLNNSVVGEKLQILEDDVVNMTKNDKPYSSRAYEKNAIVPNNSCEQEEDALFNISDSILKDVTL